MDAQEFRETNLKLLEAAGNGENELILDLLKQGASLKTRNRFGNTALIDGGTRRPC
ncbi:MAG: hypothetical protein U5P41_07820 [Gammaproteobacteria bacterium]|nr:hypothetical protein [Gammaproteobacteria bacterium]